MPVVFADKEEAIANAFALLRAGMSIFPSEVAAKIVPLDGELPTHAARR
jgi:hypothetical protein